MTPIRSINYATWAIWGIVTVIALFNAGWVRISTIEAGGAFPMTLEFFVIPDSCYVAELVSLGRHYTEMFMVPANLILIGFAIAIPWARLRTATAAYTIMTIAFTFMFDEYPRILCYPPVAANYNILSFGDLSHLEGMTPFDVISLIPRFLYLALFLVTPVKWAPVGAWIRNVPKGRVNATLTS